MISRLLFSAVDLTALDNISKLCRLHGLTVQWDDTHKFETSCRGGYSVMARIHPARYDDGVAVTLFDARGRLFLDAPGDKFAWDGPALRKLNEELFRNSAVVADLSCVA